MELQNEVIAVPEIDFFKNVEQKVETLTREQIRSAINPRQEESYAPVKMAGDIAECGFRILNKPIMAFPDEKFRKELSMSELMRLILQGHRRIAGWFYIRDNYKEFGLTVEQAKMFDTIEVETLFGVTKEQCFEFALDEKYKVNLKAWEVGKLLYERMIEVGLPSVKLSEITLNYAKLILESRLVQNGPGKLPKILDIQNRRVQNEQFVKAARNGSNQILYAARLGPWFAKQAILWLKYRRDGIPEPDNSERVITANWENLAKWHHDYVNHKDIIWVPVDDVIVEGDAKSPSVAKLVGGNKEAKKWIEREIRNDALGSRPTTKVVLSKDTKEKMSKNLDSEMGQAIVDLVVHGKDVLPQLVKLNDEYKILQERVAFLKKNKEKFSRMRNELATSIVDDDLDLEAFSKVWLAK